MISENGLKVLERRYLAKNEEGKVIETPEELFKRVSSFIASADKIYEPDKDISGLEKKFYDIMANLDFLPNSPTLMNAGRELGQLSACFVLPVEDSMEGIFDAIKHAAIIHKSGGGTGFSFSRLRSKGSSVNSTGGVASGPISFMKVFNSATEAVKQGGVRRGANMGILRVDHPDILEFIQCKKNDKEITNFNISVGITEKFMEAVEKDEEYELVEPHTKEVKGKLMAREVFDLIVDMAWNNGEPGIIFLDRMNRDNVVPELGEIESTNPCGEQPLLPFESCNLGSVNLVNCIKNKGVKKEIDFNKLGDLVDTAVHFLDNVIDVNKYPLEKIDEMTKSTRKIGLGVMGFADMLIKLGIPYDSEEAIKTAEAVMRFINERSKQASAKLAEARGAFPTFDKSTYAEKGMKLRNATTTTIAPTGTISIIAGVSSGIEPLFAVSFIRNVMDNDELPEVNPLFEKVAKERGFYSIDLMKKIAKMGSVRHIEEIPEDVRRVFGTAHDIDPIWHIRMQAMFQKYTDNAVSKTVNFRKEATREDVRKVYMLAYKLGCKGVTIYRDGSRESQVLNIGAVNKDGAKQQEQTETEQKTLKARVRPDVTVGITEKIKIGCGNLYVTVNSDENGICEVFANLGRAGGCPSQSEATSRLISIALRAGVDIKEIIEQLRGIRCHSTLRQKGLKVLSCPDAIGRTLEKVLNLQVEVKDVETIEELTTAIEEGSLGCGGNCSLCSTQCSYSTVAFGETSATIDESLDWSTIKYCPECGSTVQHEGGCMICRNCGFSKCG
ncbi:MAG: vitamin B12-dependent ribonucleotide reductase [Lutispora sp.]|jgi:ribonucleoside-diphosphate reductase alpha chain|uniref:vitamin B12-dependent ribonucleotide reductase n=1 Tax=Lutispora sp. TaxID=2828727 RepID=UPI00356608D3